MMSDQFTEADRQHAIMQGEQNTATDAYIEARQQLDNSHNRRIFEAGFERGWNAAMERINPALALAAKQARDDGLWFDATSAPEAYLQDALRKLAAAIEGPNA